MDNGAQETSSLLFYWRGLFPLLLLLILAFSLHFLVNFLYRRLFPKAEKTHLGWDSSLLKALFLPCKFLIWTLAITFGAESISTHFENETFAPFFQKIRLFTTIFLFLWIALRFIKNMEAHCTRERPKQKKRYDKMTVHAVFKVCRIGLFLIGILIYLQALNINISAVLAFGGAGGIVAGLAAKDLLANFFGGLMIYLDRPFAVGDWIRSPDREIEGYVEMIGWRLTRIRTFSKRPLYVPNGVFSTIAVENPARMSNRQIKTHVGVRYDDASKIRDIAVAIEEMLQNHPDIDTEKHFAARFHEFGPSSLNFLISCFTKTVDRTNYLRVQQNIYLEILEIIAQHGAQCAFPTATLHISDTQLPLARE